MSPPPGASCPVKTAARRHGADCVEPDIEHEIRIPGHAAPIRKNDCTNMPGPVGRSIEKMTDKGLLKSSPNVMLLVIITTSAASLRAPKAPAPLHPVTHRTVLRQRMPASGLGIAAAQNVDIAIQKNFAQVKPPRRRKRSVSGKTPQCQIPRSHIGADGDGMGIHRIAICPSTGTTKRDNKNNGDYPPPRNRCLPAVLAPRIFRHRKDRSPNNRNQRGRL